MANEPSVMTTQEVFSAIPKDVVKRYDIEINETGGLTIQQPEYVSIRATKIEVGEVVVTLKTANAVLTLWRNSTITHTNIRG